MKLFLLWWWWIIVVTWSCPRENRSFDSVVVCCCWSFCFLFCFFCTKTTRGFLVIWSYILVSSLVSRLCEWQLTGRLMCPQAASFMAPSVCVVHFSVEVVLHFSAFLWRVAETHSENSSSARTTTTNTPSLVFHCVGFSVCVMLSNESGN